MKFKVFMVLADAKLSKCSESLRDTEFSSLQCHSAWIDPSFKFSTGFDFFQLPVLIANFPNSEVPTPIPKTLKRNTAFFPWTTCTSLSELQSIYHFYFE